MNIILPKLSGFISWLTPIYMSREKFDLMYIIVPKLSGFISWLTPIYMSREKFDLMYIIVPKLSGFISWLTSIHMSREKFDLMFLKNGHWYFRVSATISASTYLDDSSWFLTSVAETINSYNYFFHWGEVLFHVYTRCKVTYILTHRISKFVCQVCLTVKTPRLINKQVAIKKIGPQCVHVWLTLPRDRRSTNKPDRVV